MTGVPVNRLFILLTGKVYKLAVTITLHGLIAAVVYLPSIRAKLIIEAEVIWRG